ncbi:MAG: PKD domain-containing protein [Bacteroidetes bacterium]|nr:MAG: PKD domain-containing protein [Bacteroidota bacterium]
MNRIITALLIFFSFAAFGQENNKKQPANWVQMMHDPNVNFYDVQKAFNDYWKDREIIKGAGYKQYKRWEAFMEPRVYPSGKKELASLAYENFKKWEKEHPAYQNKSSNGNWTSLGPVGKPTNGGAGRLNFVRFDPSNPNTIFVGAPVGGLWKSTNSGSSWSSNTDQLTVIGCTDIAIDPNNSQIMYLATGDGDARDSYSVGVLKSTDGGNSWNTTGLNWSVTEQKTISRLLIDPTNSNMIIAATSAGIYRSLDAGANWTIERTGSYKDMEFKPGDPNTIYAAGTSFVRSTDNGNNWSTITSGLPSSGQVARIAIAVSNANSNYVYLVIGENTNYGLLGVYRSSNSGTSFTQRDSGTLNLLSSNSDGSGARGQAWYDLAIAASHTNAEEIYVGGVNIWRSTSGGSSWSLVAHWWGDNAPYVHADQHDLIFSGSTLYSGNDGGIFRTTNSGSSWTDLSSNLVIAQQYQLGLSASSPNLIIAGHQDNGSNLFSSGTWTNVMGGDGMYCLIDRTNNNVMYASYQYGQHQRSTNGGSWFDPIDTDLPSGSGNAHWESPLHQDPVTATTLYAGGRSNLYRSTNQGTNWTMLGAPGGSGDILEFDIAPSNNQVIYAIQQNRAARSSNGGSSWTNISTGLPISSLMPEDITVSDDDPNIAWITFSGYSASSKIYKTTNGGSSWTNISSGLPNVPCNTVVHDYNSTNGAIYVGTDIGVYYTDNDLGAWQFFSTGLPRVVVRDLEIYYPTGLLRAATYGRGTWESDLYSLNSPPVADFVGAPTSIFEGQSVNFTNISTGNPTGYNWSFSGGTPSSSTATNPSVTYNTAGVYPVSLTATNAFGSDTETKTSYITVTAIDPPVAAFSADKVSICPFASINFTDESTGDNLTYSWSFPGGTPNTSSSPNPTVSYPFAGTYTVTLVVSNGGGSSTETKTDYISVGTGNGLDLPFSEGFTSGVFPPNANWNVVDAGGSGNWEHTTTAGLAPTDGNSVRFDNYSFDDSGSNDEFWLPGLNLAGYQSVTLSFDLAYTTYDAANFDGLEILVSDNCGNSFTSVYSKSNMDLSTTGAPLNTQFVPTSGQWRRETIDLSAYSSASNLLISFKNIAGYGNTLYIDNIEITGMGGLPTANFGKNVSDLCEGESVTYNSVVTGNPTSYNWSFPGGTPSSSTDPNPTVSYSTAGTYDVTLTVSNANGSDTESKTGFITVKSSPTPTVSASGATSLCSGEELYLISSYASSNVWNTGSTNDSLLVTSSGSYSVTVTQNGCSGQSAVTDVTFFDLPSISEGTITATSTCASSDGSIQVNGTATGTISWSGTGNGSANNITLPYTINNLAAGSYQISFQDQNGCSATDLQATVDSPNKPGIPSISTNGSTTICDGENLTLTSSSSVNNVWSTGETSQSITVAQGGTYTLLISDNGCDSDPASITITVNSKPIITTGVIVNPSACGNSDGSIQVNGSGNGTLSWTGVSSGSTSTSLPFNISSLKAGSYSVVFNDGCESNMLTLSLNDPGAPSAPVISADGPTTFCEGGSVTLSSSANNNTWSNGSTDQSITVSTSGTYSVTSIENGCTSEAASIQVTVEPKPVISAGSLVNASDCSSSDGSVVISANGVSSGDLSWTGPSSGSMTGVNMPFTVNNLEVGTYQFNFSTLPGCSSPEIQVTIESNTQPTAPVITTDGSTVICEGTELTLTSSSETGNHWSTGETTKSIVVSTAGTFTLYAVINGCVSETAQIDITSTPSPTISAGLLINPSSCGTNTGSIAVNGSGSGTITWSGTSGGTLAATLPTTIQNLKAGSYDIVFNDGCPSNTLSLSLSDPGAPDVPTISASGPVKFCEGDSVVLTSSVADGLFWSNGETSQSIVVKTEGTYSVSASQNNCTSSSKSITVIVYPTPQVILEDFGTVCLGQGIVSLDQGDPSGGTYSGDGISGNTFDPTVAGVGSHTITYSFTDGNGCSNTISGDIIVDACASVEEMESASFLIFPNPAKEQITIKNLGNSKIERVQFYNSLGQIIMDVPMEHLEKQISIQELASGSYQIRFVTEQGTVWKKIQIHH